ncbi:aminotransferase class III-fold pyridoxal phosphate-dependent enzyme [Paucibacter sp. DJ1R-11]|uniref:aminotransferase class III-fold pyridoxal phosphate-dependent enzyme n=1 Tax=Paucibacter sp. DJ1R-11 TaxID=2893556 RepID=UPI0021E37511|nr:aminotransferase class III-fold pyridoxal phosphate-dependent enzyme [Paucibacter sp. DJ1R-11]MCV2364214.1 aminotransferase class III-fold pyridoxal phosphate-dependent enzyme [Paucibacter sp. DJ1R-11]
MTSSSTPLTPQQDWQRRSVAAVWHPCTQMARAEVVPPLPIARGAGPWLYDYEGRRYFDANSSWWVNLFGHADAGLNAAIKAQLDTLPHVMLAGCTHAPAVRLAERLSSRTGGALGHVFFGSDGASAVEIALKQSFHSWRNRGRAEKREFVCLKNGYHGETIGALAVTDVKVFRDAYDPLLMRAHIVESPDARLGNEAAALAAMRELLSERGPHIAAVIIEPLVQGAAGMVMYDAAYLRGLRALCTEFEVHLIVDEIAMGCGRTGTFFAWEHVNPRSAGTPPAPRGGQAALGSGPAGGLHDEAVWPDFITLSKGITGGTMPLSLVLTTEAVYQAFWSEDVSRGFLHSHSYTGNALACAAANAVLDRFDAGQLQANAEQAQLLKDAFAPLASHPRVADLRQLGMVLAFDVIEPGLRFAKTSGLGETSGFAERFGETLGFAERFHLAARAHELLIRPIGGTVYLMPPYLIDAEAAAFLARAVRLTLDEVLSQSSEGSAQPLSKEVHVA